MTVTRYVIENRAGEEVETGYYEESEYEKAKDAAREAGACVIAYEYEYADSHIVDDFTPDDEAADDPLAGQDLPLTPRALSAILRRTR